MSAAADAPIRIERVSGDDFINGKLLSLIVKVSGNKIPCSKKLKGLRDYWGDGQQVYKATQGDTVVGFLAFRRVKEEREEAPPRDTIVIDTLCATTKEVETALMNEVPWIIYSTGASPRGLPSNYTAAYGYNREKEGDPTGLRLPGPVLTNRNNNNGWNNEENTEHNSNGYSNRVKRHTNFSRKTSGPSAFFPKLTVKTRRNRRKSRKMT